MHDKITLNPLLAQASFEQLCKDAISIVMGNVVRVLPSKAAKDLLTGRPLVYTDVEIHVKKWFKDPKPFENIIIRSLGGQTPELSMDVPGIARFAPAENVVVFLSKDAGQHFELPNDAFVVQGWALGKYSVQQNDAMSPLQPKPLKLQELTARISRYVHDSSVSWG